MKKTVLMLCILGLLGACKDKVRQEYIANVPVYTDYETFRSVGGYEAARPISQKGNIYFKDDFLFMVEPNEGIHFIDNSNPSSPVQAGFLKIWGATGMSIKGDYLYANSLIDLVIYDLSTITNPVFVDRMEDVFPTALPVSEKNYPYKIIDKNLGVVTSWKQEKVSEDITNNNPSWVSCFECDFETIVVQDGVFSEGSGAGQTSISGSITLFTILNDYLYIVEEGNFLHPINISNPTAPVAHDVVGLWGGVETIFPYQNYLFMGTPSGILIYGTDSPNNPNYIASLSHARGCDPVVVKDDYAYVTVRSGGPCGGDINQLDVIDVSTISNPILMQSFDMNNPHGLGIDGDLLFICDGDAGLKVFDATDPLTVGDHLNHQFKNIQATDIIPFNTIAMVIGDDGIYQYDYSNPSEMILLSKISF